jgi:hypothetical protein
VVRDKPQMEEEEKKRIIQEKFQLILEKDQETLHENEQEEKIKSCERHHNAMKVEEEY